MYKLPRYILIFSVTFALLLVAPAFLKEQFPMYPLMNWGDVLDSITPLILLPLYWILFWYASDEKVKLVESLVFVGLAGLWAEGQGMHLSANSIGHQLEETVHGDIYVLTEFFDEKLSHYMWHLGIFGLAALLIHCEWKKPADGEINSWGMLIPAGFIHGFTIFLIVIEAGTAPISVPIILFLLLLILLRDREKIKSQPLISFFFMSWLFTILLTAGWWIYWSGLPEFSEVGII